MTDTKAKREKKRLFRLTYTPSLGFADRILSELYRAKNLSEAFLQAECGVKRFSNLVVKSVEEVQE